MGVSAELSVRRGREAIAFYAAAFGARVVYQVGGTDDAPEVVAELALGDTTFWVSDEAPDYGNHSPESLGGCTVRLLLRVDDPVAVQARAVALGADQSGDRRARLAARPDQRPVRPRVGDRQAADPLAARQRPPGEPRLGRVLRVDQVEAVRR